MNRVHSIEYKSQEIIVLDLSGIQDPAEALAPIEQMRELVAGRDDASVLTLTNVAGLAVDEKLATALWDLLKANKKQVRAGAVVGISSDAQRDLLDLLTHQSRRELERFDDEVAAKDWLVEQ